MVGFCPCFDTKPSPAVSLPLERWRCWKRGEGTGFQRSLTGMVWSSTPDQCYHAFICFFFPTHVFHLNDSYWQPMDIPQEFRTTKALKDPKLSFSSWSSEISSPLKPNWHGYHGWPDAVMHIFFRCSGGHSTLTSKFSSSSSATFWNVTILVIMPSWQK